MSRADIISLLSRHADTLRARGIMHVALFGSHARGDDSHLSDIDLVLTLDPNARIDGFELMEIKFELAKLLNAPVDIITKPIRRPSLRDEIEEDAVLAF